MCSSDLAANRGGVAVAINAGAGDAISLRGLVIDGAGSGVEGILFEGDSGSALHVQNCVVRNFNGQFAAGIAIEPSAHQKVFISDTLVANNGDGTANSANIGGIRIFPLQSSANLDAVFNRVRLENNNTGLYVGAFSGSTHVLVRDSAVSDNEFNGIWVETASNGASGTVLVQNTTSVSNGGAGIIAQDTGATIIVSKSTVVRNGSGLSTDGGGQILSYSNNEIDNNVGSDGTPAGFLTQR